MTTPSIRVIAKALEQALQSVGGLNTAPFLKDSFTAPVAMVAIDTVEYHSTFRSGDVAHNFTVHTIVGRADDRAAWDALEEYMSQGGNQRSISGALESDQSLGGLVSGVVVSKSGPPEPLAIGSSGAVYITVPFVVTVHA